LQKINDLILKKNTGTPKEFALKLRVSERCLYKQLTLLKKLGAPIVFCPGANSYQYSQSGGFIFTFDSTPPPPPRKQNPLTNKSFHIEPSKSNFSDMYFLPDRLWLS